MFKVALITLFAIGSYAAPQYGALSQSGLSGSSYGSVLSHGSSLGGYAAPALQNAYAAAPNAYETNAAIQTRRTVEVRPVAHQQDYAQPQVINVQPEELPVQVHFRTGSSRVNVQQTHTPGQPQAVEHASFQDEPHRVVHEVVKPVIQEVREIIQPYRRVTQEIRPVIEEVHTVVHKGEGRRQAPLRNPGYGNVGGGHVLSNGYKGAAKAKAARA